MLPPIHKNFRIYFKKDFIYPEIRHIFNQMLKQKSEMYEDIVDFINQSVIQSKFPGISDTGGPEQKFGKGRTVTYQGGLPTKEYVGKLLPISFRMTDFYLNYFTIYTNMVKHLDHASVNDKIFLPNIHCQILDDEDNVFLEFIYKNIKFENMDPIDLSKKNNNVINTEFTVNFLFNDFDILFHSFNFQATRNSQKHEYDYLDKVGGQE